MALQKAGRYRIGLGSFDCPTQNRGFRLAPGKQQNLAGLKDSANSHGNRVGRDIGFATKVPGSIPSSQAIKSYHPSPRVRARSGLVKPDVTSPTNSHDLNIDPAGFLYLALVVSTVFEYLITFGQTGGHMRLFGWQIDMTEELNLHEMPITLRMIGRETIIFIEIEGNNVAERKTFLSIQANQFLVQLHPFIARAPAEWQA